MQDKQPKAQRRLLEEFPEINADVAENIDIKTKTGIMRAFPNPEDIYRIQKGKA